MRISQIEVYISDYIKWNIPKDETRLKFKEWRSGGCNGMPEGDSILRIYFSRKWNGNHGWEFSELTKHGVLYFDKQWVLEQNWWKQSFVRHVWTPAKHQSQWKHFKSNQKRKMPSVRSTS